MRFLAASLRRKFESRVFASQWDDVRARMNTKCQVKRRTVIRRLQKQPNSQYQELYERACDFQLDFFVSEYFVVRINLHTTAFWCRVFKARLRDEQNGHISIYANSLFCGPAHTSTSVTKKE